MGIKQVWWQPWQGWDRGYLKHWGPYNPGDQKWLLRGGDVWAIGLVSLANGSSSEGFRASTTVKPMYLTIAVRAATKVHSFKRLQRSTLFPSWRSWAMAVRFQPALNLCKTFKTVKCWLPEYHPHTYWYDKTEFTAYLSKGEPTSQSCGSISHRNGKVRIYW